MKTPWTALTTLALTILLVAGLVGMGWWFLGHIIWSGSVQAQDTASTAGPWNASSVDATSSANGYTGCPAASIAIATVPITRLEEARAAAQAYVSQTRYRNLKVAEVIDFSQNYYALVKESDTGTGAMELLIDKATGAAGPEYGPNMMWNAKYGMHRGKILGGVFGRMDVSPAEARQVAQEWLDTYRPGETLEQQPDAFYGYYTIHTLRDGVTAGMLSVNGANGQVWYHTWHGAFVQRIAAGQ